MTADSLKIYRDLKNVIDTAFDEGKAECIEEGIQKGKAEGIEEGIQKGLEKGREEGAEQAKLEVARKLIASGFSAEQAASIAGISVALLQSS